MQQQRNSSTSLAGHGLGPIGVSYQTDCLTAHTNHLLFALEKKLTETLEDKMLMMEDKMIILQQNSESEERIIHTLATMRDFQVGP